jgi:hypothetical protein
MEFLFADGSLHRFSRVASAEFEDGLLVGRDHSGEFVFAFARAEIVACGENLQLAADADQERRSNRTA